MGWEKGFAGWATPVPRRQVLQLRQPRQGRHGHDAEEGDQERSPRDDGVPRVRRAGGGDGRMSAQNICTTPRSGGANMLVNFSNIGGGASPLNCRCFVVR